MKGLITYWTMTGNTEDLAYRIAKDTGFDIMPISEVKNEELTKYDIILLGCPAMGNEELEESEFRPFYQSIKPIIEGKDVALFGTYGWGGIYMNAWVNDALSSGLKVKASIIVIGNSSSLDEIEYKEFLNKILN